MKFRRNSTLEETDFFESVVNMHLLSWGTSLHLVQPVCSRVADSSDFEKCVPVKGLEASVDRRSRLPPMVTIAVVATCTGRTLHVEL